jgi:4-hydroxy-tetrahydrodipicolinate synthase
MMADFHGTGVALVTPFLNDGRIDFDSLARLVNHCIEGGVDYLVVLGTTGESATLSAEEKAAVLEGVKKANQGRKPLVLGHGGNDTSRLISGMQSIEWEGVDAILSVSPYYNKPSQAGIEAHYEALATDAPVPVIMYNVPGRTGSNMSVSTTLKLATHPNIIGIKEASGNVEQAMAIAAGTPDDFLLISGDDLLTPALISVGATGAISVLANSHPGEFSQMVNLSRSRDYEAAAGIWKNWISLNPLLYEEGNPVGIKALLEQMGICQAFVRQPLQKASAGLTTRIREAAGL